MSFTPTPINPTTDSVKPSPFIAFTQRVIPATFDQSLSYQEALYAILKYLNDMSETVNTNANVTDQQTAVIGQLTDYVNHYFDNLDVQEEINNKLDEMSEDGTLQNIIESYIELNSIIVFDTLADLKATEGVINGSTVKTLGYNTKGDGGGATYKIRTVTNQDTEDDKIIVALTNLPSLIGEFVCEDSITPEQFGADGSGTNDVSSAMQTVINYAASNKLPINLKGRYLINSTVSFNSNTAMIVNGSQPQIGNTLNESTTAFANIIFGNDGLFETTGTTTVTFNNIGFNGSNKAIVFKSFRNRVLNCGFNGFDTAISVESGTNWNGENVISKCVFNTVTHCIVLNSGSDGDIEGNLADGDCTTFISGGNDNGYKIINNHDYSSQGSTIAGYNVTFVANYIDGFDKLTITGNSGCNITGNTFIGAAPTDGVHQAIKYTSSSVANGTITGNIVCVSGANNVQNEYLHFININDVTTFARVTISGNTFNTCKSLMYPSSDGKIYQSNIDNTTRLGYDILDSTKATMDSFQGNITGGQVIAHGVVTLTGTQTTSDNIRLKNICDSWLHIIKMNDTDMYFVFGDNKVKLQGAWANATKMEFTSIGLRAYTNSPLLASN